jgi:hypothetical protein
MPRAFFAGFAFWILLVFGAPQLAQTEEIAVAENPSNSHEPDREVELEQVKPSEEKVKASLDWRFDALKVVIRTFGTSKESSLVVQGRLKGEGRGKIFCEGHSFSVSADGEFELEVSYNGQSTRLDLAFISPSGSIAYETLNYRIKPLPVEDLRQVPEAIPVIEFNRELDRRAYFALGTGISSIRYSQSDSLFTDYRSTVWSIKGAFNYFLAPPVWDLGISGFMNLSTLASNSTADVRFIGANARIGYVFPGVEKPWRLALYGGWYYSTMVADNLSFGYRNISGPQVYPTLRRAFANGTALSSYLKFSTIADRLGLLNLGNNEFAAGLSYLIPVFGNPYLIGLDYARLRFAIQGRQIETSSWSLGLSRAF